MSIDRRIDLKNDSLNARLPGYAIVREFECDDGLFRGRNGKDNRIDRNYWENAITVQDFLQKVAERGVLAKFLANPYLFKKLLVKLHIQQSRGLLRNKPYNGQSAESGFSKDWQQRFRNPNFRVFARANFSNTNELRMYCELFDSQYWNSPSCYRKKCAIFSTMVGGKHFSAPIDVFLPKMAISSSTNERVVEESLRELVSKDGFVSQDRNFICVFFMNRAFLIDADERNTVDPNEIVTFILYPSVRYIPLYLEEMRYNLCSVLDSDSSEKDEQLKHLAKAYQVGIQSQAFETVWNSELMGIVNFFLINHFHLRPIAHGTLDFKALLLSPQAFEKYFFSFVKIFNKEILEDKIFNIKNP